MKQLDKNWFSTGLIDLEYKQYVLLDYFQYVKKSFDDKKLFPAFQNLLSTYRTTQEYKNEISSFKESIKIKHLVAVDWSQSKLVYEEEHQEDCIIDEIEKIVDYSIPLFKEHIQIGRDMYDSIERRLEIVCIGLEPIMNTRGFIIIRFNKEFVAYKYSVSIIEDCVDRQRMIHMEELCRYKSTLTNNIENIKTKLLKKFDISNPATYFVDTESNEFSIEDAILPILKRKFLSTLF